MSRSIRLALACAVACAAMAGAAGIGPGAVAGSNIAADAPLLVAPDWGAEVVTTLPTGSAVSIDGGPTGSFYPVSANGFSGWVDGGVLRVTKETAPAAGQASASEQPLVVPDPLDVPITETPSAAADAAPTLKADGADQTADASGSAPMPPTLAEGLAQESAPPAGVHDPESPSPQPSPAGSSEPASIASPTQTPANADTVDPTVAPASEAAGEVATAAAILASPAPSVVPAAPSDVVGDAPPALPTDPDRLLDPTATAAVPAPAPISAPPTPTPAPTPEPTPGPTETLHGFATVVDNAPLLEWPDPSSGLVFSVPAGSTIELLGEQNGRYVKATYMYLYGWIDLGALTDAATVRDELVPDDAEEVDVRTPRPGSGVAFTTVDLSLRAGPSATESVLAPVEAGTRVVLTGVMENGFQRVTFGDLVGWIANDYLSLPADPTPTPNPKREDRPAYSERQIIKIIYAAADTYGQDRADMLRVARCESGLDPYAVNPSGSYGLFQFIRSTWKSTPYGQEDIFDPRANANAASWMWSQGRQAEWICK